MNYGERDDDFSMRNKSGKILIFLLAPLPPDGKPGGIGTWTITILNKLSTSSDYKLIHVDTAVKWRSVTDLRIYKRIAGGAIQAAYDVIRSCMISIKCKPDVIHLCSSGGPMATCKDILVIASQKIMGVRTVIHYHMGRIPAIVARGGWSWKLHCIAISLADSVIVLDKNSELSLRKLFFDKIKRIPNAINPISVNSINRNIAENSRTRKHANLVFIGWGIRAKGLCELIEACINIVHCKFTLRVVGPIEQDFKDELQQVAIMKDNGNWLHFVGPVSYVESLQYMYDADIFVLPSHTEGFPYVIAEAMALGKPIVATKVGAIPEMLNDNGEIFGLLVCPRNERELRNALVYLLDHPDEAKALGARASDRAMSLYSIDNVFKQYDELWKLLADKKG